jgi:hypothetical protein
MTKNSEYLDNLPGDPSASGCTGDGRREPDDYVAFFAIAGGDGPTGAQPEAVLPGQPVPRTLETGRSSHSFSGQNGGAKDGINVRGAVQYRAHSRSDFGYHDAENIEPGTNTSMAG